MDEQKKQELIEALRREAKEGRISCAAAFRLTEELGVSRREVGQMCDELKIKIVSCQLGCF